MIATLLVLASISPAVAAAQTPGGNAGGSQYLPSLSGGGGNQDEAALEDKDGRGASGLKSSFVGGEDEGARLGPALPVALLVALLAALAVGRRRHHPADEGGVSGSARSVK